MLYRFKLRLRNTSSPHLYLDQIKELIKNDEFLLPAMRGYLLFMKKTNRSYITLPLESEVIISKELKRNFTRGLSPKLTEFNILEWTDTDTKKYDENPIKFVGDIKKLYSKMGYEIEDLEIPSIEKLKKTLEDFEKKKEKYELMKGVKK